jgi:hypothetical protein
VVFDFLLRFTAFLNAFEQAQIICKVYDCLLLFVFDVLSYHYKYLLNKRYKLLMEAEEVRVCVEYQIIDELIPRLLELRRKSERTRGVVAVLGVDRIDLL